MVASTACVLALIALDRFGWASAPALLVLVSLFSLTNPLTMAGIRSLLPRLVPTDALDRANALDTSLNGMADIAGPALAGVIVGFGGATLAFGLIAALYMAASACVGTILARAAGSRALGRCSPKPGAACCAWCAGRPCAGWRSPTRCMKWRGAC